MNPKKRQLIAIFDVATLDASEADALTLAVAVQSERIAEHSGAPVPALTIAYAEGDMVLRAAPEREGLREAVAAVKARCDRYEAGERTDPAYLYDVLADLRALTP